MSNKLRIKKKQQHEAKVEKQGKNVVKWIIVGLIVLAIVYMAFTFSTLS